MKEWVKCEICQQSQEERKVFCNNCKVKNPNAFGCCFKNEEIENVFFKLHKKKLNEAKGTTHFTDEEINLKLKELKII